MPAIDLYPAADRPPWLRVGCRCYCLGEGLDIFTVSGIGTNAATLKTASGYDHGWESIAKLHLGDIGNLPPIEQPPPPKTWAELKAEKKRKRRGR